MTFSRETGLLRWIGLQTCNFERSIAIWLHSFLNILIFSIFSATTLSWLHLSWLWKFQSWQSRLFHRWNWCGKSRLFYQKGKSPQEQQQSIKIQKNTICKTRTQTYRALPQWFWSTFPQKNVKYVNQSLIDTLKAYNIQGPRFSIRMVIGIFCSVTVFVQLNQYSQIPRRQCCLVYRWFPVLWV